MRQVFVVAAVALVLAAAAAASVSAFGLHHRHQETDADEVQAGGNAFHSFFFKWRGTFRGRDAKGLAALYEEDCYFKLRTAQGGVEELKGRAEIQKFWEMVFTQSSSIRSYFPKIGSAMGGTAGMALMQASTINADNKTGEIVNVGIFMQLSKNNLLAVYDELVAAPFTNPQANATEMKTFLEDFVTNIFRTRSASRLSQQLALDFNEMIYTGRGGVQRVTRADYIKNIEQGLWKNIDLWQYEFNCMYVCQDFVFMQIGQLITYKTVNGTAAVTQGWMGRAQVRKLASGQMQLSLLDGILTADNAQ